MNKAKFKTGDLVENIHTGEIHLITDMLGKKLIQIDGLAWFLTYSMATGEMSFKNVNPKSVKFNLGKRTKINFDTVTNGNYEVIPKEEIAKVNARIKKGMKSVKFNLK